MLSGGPDRRNVTTLLVTFVLLAGCLGTAIGAMPAGVSGDRSGAPGGATGETPAEPSPDAGVVHPDLQNVTGEVTVVVRFPELRDASARGQSRRERGDQLRSHAADTRAAFDEFVADREGVTVDRSFWVANANLVTVDTDAVALEELAAVDGVREIHPNYRIEASSTATAATGADVGAPGTGDGVDGPGTGDGVDGPGTGDGVDGPETGDGVDVLETEGGVDAAEPGDGDRRTTYGLEQIRAPAAWDRFGTRGAGVSVAVLDTGVDPDHPDIDVDESRWAEFDDAGDRVGSTPYDSAEHGTHTSGTVAGGNASGTHIGVAPDATLYHGKVLHDGTGTWAAAIAGIEWASTEAEVDVVSMSLGADTYYPAFIEPIRQANDMGVVVVASAGNHGEGASNSPGNSYDTVAVGAVDEDRNVASSSSGERVDTADAWGSDAPDDWPEEYAVPNVAAPGVDVLSAEPGGEYGRRSGTSMAAPHVAGVVALVRAAGGDDLSQDEMRALLERTARKPPGAPPGTDTRYGAGVVDAYAATALGSADSAVTGQVVDADADPVAGSRVETGFGYGTDADEDGSYRLEVPSTEQTLIVDGYGHEPETVVVAPANETLRRDLVLSTPTLAARTTATPPERVDPGETLTYEFAVSNVTAVTVDPVPGTAVAQGEATLRVDGERVTFGERRTYAEPKVGETVTVEVETTAGTVGAIELASTFEDGNESITRRTPRTHVHSDPLRVPADYDPADLQSAVDVAAPGTTLLLDERASGPHSLSVREGATEPAGLSIRKPLTVAAEPGARPVLAVADPADDGVAVESTADGVAFSGITVDGDGTGAGVRTTAPASLTDVAVRNATVGFDLRAETRARDVTLDGAALGFDARDVAISRTDTPTPAPEDHERVGSAVDVAVAGPSPRADLAVGYDPVDATRLEDDTVRAWRYDESADEWTVVVASWAETADRRVIAPLDAVGTIAPMAERRPAEFVVDGVAAPSAVGAGEPLTANATVTNAGVRTATRDVELRLDGDVVAIRSLTLADGETGDVSLSHTVDRDRSPGPVELAVATADDTRRSDLEVLEPAEFTIGDLTTPATAERGDVLEVAASVENAGDREATQRLEVRFGADLDGDAADGDYEVLATDAPALAAGESATVSFTVEVPADADSGALSIGVFGADGDARGTIDVSGDDGADDGSDGSTGGGGGGDAGGSDGSGAGIAPAPPAPPDDGDAVEEETGETDDAEPVQDGDVETADIVDAAPDRPGVSVPLRNTSVSEITFLDGDATGSLTVREGVDDDLAAPSGAAVARLSVSVPAALTDRPATIRATFDPAAVDGEALTMYRYADGTWRALETSVTRSDGSLVVTAETPGFSRFALVHSDGASAPSDDRSTATDAPSATETTSAASQPAGTDGPSAAETSTRTGTQASSTSPTEDDGAGLGAGAALLAVVVGLLVARRGTR